MCISDMRCWQKLRLPQFQSLKQLYGADRISRSPAFSFNLTNSTSSSFQRKVEIETRSCRRNDKNAFRKNLTNDQIEWRPKAQRSVICLEPKMENEKGTCVYMCGCRPKMQQNLKPRYFISYQKSWLIGCQSTAFGTKRQQDWQTKCYRIKEFWPPGKSCSFLFQIDPFHIV